MGAWSNLKAEWRHPHNDYRNTDNTLDWYCGHWSYSLALRAPTDRQTNKWTDDTDNFTSSVNAGGNKEEQEGILSFKLIPAFQTYTQMSLHLLLQFIYCFRQSNFIDVTFLCDLHFLCLIVSRCLIMWNLWHSSQPVWPCLCNLCYWVLAPTNWPMCHVSSNRQVCFTGPGHLPSREMYMYVSYVLMFQTTFLALRRYGTVDFVTSEHSPAQHVPYCRNFILPCPERYWTYWCWKRTLNVNFSIFMPYISYILNCM